MELVHKMEQLKQKRQRGGWVGEGGNVFFSLEKGFQKEMVLKLGWNREKQEGAVPANDITHKQGTFTGEYQLHSGAAELAGVKCR